MSINSIILHEWAFLDDSILIEFLDFFKHHLKALISIIPTNPTKFREKQQLFRRVN